MWACTKCDDKPGENLKCDVTKEMSVSANPRPPSPIKPLHYTIFSSAFYITRAILMCMYESKTYVFVNFCGVKTKQ